jgi:hypothetical protein
LRDAQGSARIPLRVATYRARKASEQPRRQPSMLDVYPAGLRKCIAHRGGLSSKMIFLHGKELAEIVPSCGSKHRPPVVRSDMPPAPQSRPAIRGDSYRLRAKRKSGLIKPAAVLAAGKDKPSGWPSLTAAARDGRTIVRAGMEEWLRRGPNKRMTPNRRAKCGQTRYPDPKLSTVHENGASGLPALIAPPVPPLPTLAVYRFKAFWTGATIADARVREHDRARERCNFEATHLRAAKGHPKIGLTVAACRIATCIGPEREGGYRIGP